MGYGGGTVTQPILGGFDELGKLLLQGQAQVTATVLEIEKRRTDEVNQLAKVAGEISATGIEGYDNVIQNFAAQNADRLAVAHEKNRRGDMTLGEVSKIRSKLMKNNQLLANQSKIHDENMKAIFDGVESGKLSPLSIDAQNALWFADPNMKNSVFKAPALNSQGNAKFDAQGNPITIMRKAEEAVQNNLIEDEMYVTKMKEVQSVGADGNPIFDDNGYPVTETKVWQMPAAQFLSPSRKATLAYNLVDEVTDLNKTLGKRIAVVDKATGTKTVMPYEKVFETPGTMIYGYTLAEEELSDIVGRVEKTLDGLTDEKYKSILHDLMGAKAEWQPEFEGPRNLDIVNSEEELNYMIGTAGQMVKIPKYYDAMGNPIGDFTYDPLVLQTGKDGTIHLTDEQRKIGKAFVRDAMLKSLNVTQKEFKEHKEGKRRTKEQEYLDVTLATHSKKVNGVTSTNEAAGYDYLNGIAIQQTLAAAGGDTGVGNLETARTQFDSTGVVSVSDYSMDNQLDSFIKLVAQAEAMGEVKGINLSSDVKKIAEKDFSLSTTTGQKLENFSQAFLVNTPGELPKLAFVGDAIMASSIDDYKLKYGGGKVAEQALKMNVKNEVVSPGIVVADNRKAAQFYRIMYQNNPQFQKIVEGAGFKGISANHSVHGKNAVMDALITYFTNKQ